MGTIKKPSRGKWAVGKDGKMGESSWEGLVATSFVSLFFYNKKMNKKYNWIIDLKIT